jgi:hypothetical protein
MVGIHRIYACHDRYTELLCGITEPIRPGNLLTPRCEFPHTIYYTKSHSKEFKSCPKLKETICHVTVKYQPFPLHVPPKL